MALLLTLAFLLVGSIGTIWIVSVAVSHKKVLDSAVTDTKKSEKMISNQSSYKKGSDAPEKVSNVDKGNRGGTHKDQGVNKNPDSKTPSEEKETIVIPDEEKKIVQSSDFYSDAYVSSKASAQTPTPIEISSQSAVKASEKVTTKVPAEIHTHHWVAQTQILHHKSQIQQIYVVDQTAWEEPIYENHPVYETYTVDICGVCGKELGNSSDTLGEHADSHIDWTTLENSFWYYTEYRQRQVGTQLFQTGTIYHEEIGHYETVVVGYAYEETVLIGYECSICGAEK